jgi:HAMP domain-containing protein
VNGEIDPSIVTPGTAGALVVLFLAVATYFIVRGVLKHIRRIPNDAAEPVNNQQDDEQQ